MATPPVNWLIAVLAGTVAVALAEAATHDAARPPDADFLEFLGSWQTGDDRWVDPFQPDDESGVADGRKTDSTEGERGPTNHPPARRGDTRPRREGPAYPRRDVTP
jgi:hypothetical protein